MSFVIVCLFVCFNQRSDFMRGGSGGGDGVRPRSRRLEVSHGK